MAEDVRAGSADILRVIVQPVRLRRYLRFHLRGGVVRGQGWLLRPIGAQSFEAVEDFQSKQKLCQISNNTANLSR